MVKSKEKKKCEECEEEDSIHYCVECEEYLCNTCSTILHSLKKRKDHKIKEEEREEEGGGKEEEEEKENLFIKK